MTLVFPAMLDHNVYRKPHTIILSIPITPAAVLFLPVRKKKSDGRPGSNSFVRKIVAMRTANYAIFDCLIFFPHIFVGKISIMKGNFLLLCRMLNVSADR